MIRKVFAEHLSDIVGSALGRFCSLISGLNGSRRSSLLRALHTIALDESRWINVAWSHGSETFLYIGHLEKLLSLGRARLLEGQRRRPAACRRRSQQRRHREGWHRLAQNPRALAGRLRRAQTFLRALGIEVAFSREGRAGSRVIRISGTPETSVSTVSSVPHDESQPGSRQPLPGPSASVVA